MAAALVFAWESTASDKPRTISLHNIHTKETISVVYKRNGQYLPDAMKQINWILRDWRRNEATTMDPALIDLIWEVHAELGSAHPVHIISGYRSRNTNEMLRKTSGGQASQSRHILGKAADVHFPDVPVRQLRYSALIRERGGVGYYPTSAIPFVHLDIDRVRHWPRMPRQELALLFPKGRTQHLPSDGRPITRDDTAAARQQNPVLATQVAQFFADRDRPRAPAPTLVASAEQLPWAPKPTVAARPIPPPAPKPQVIAALTPPAPPVPRPRLVAEPRVIERSSRLQPGPSDADRGKLEQLMTLAALDPRSGPSTAGADRRAADTPQQTATRDARAQAGLSPTSAKSASPVIEATWVVAPAFDDEHPEELSYRPFPVAPWLTESPSADDPVLIHLSHPDLARTIEYIDELGAVAPMRFRPGQQVAQVLWAQEFRGEAVSYEALAELQSPGPSATGIAQRSVAVAP